MYKKEIIKGNELIAKFMGYQILYREYQYNDYNSSNEYYFRYNKGHIVCDSEGYEVMLYPGGDPLFELSELPFDSSWDWLMPVVEKISSLGFNINITKGTKDYLNSCYIEDNTGNTIHEDYENINIVLESLIEIVWFECILFVKWYNKNEMLCQKEK